MHLFRCLSIFLLLCVISLSRADETSDKLVGVWKGTTGGHDAYWTITNNTGKWSIRAVYKKGETETGAGTGLDIKYADGVLSFTRKLSKKPDKSWTDKVPAVIKYDGGQVKYSAGPGLNKTWSILEPAGEPKVVAKKEIKTEPGVAKKEIKKEPDVAKKETKEAAGSDAVKVELAKLEGNWALVSSEQAGMKSDPEIAKKVKLVVNAGKWSVYVSDRVSTSAKFTIDPANQPKAIDLTGTMGGDKGKKYLGIYQLDGDNLTLCIGDTKTRPRTFNTKKGTDWQLEVWKRMKE